MIRFDLLFFFGLLGCLLLGIDITYVFALSFFEFGLLIPEIIGTTVNFLTLLLGCPFPVVWLEIRVGLQFL